MTSMKFFKTQKETLPKVQDQIKKESLTPKDKKYRKMVESNSDDFQA